MKTLHQPSSTIGLFSLVCLIIGNMIGSGVYISSSYALGALGDARLVLLAWLIGGLHAICGAIAYAALARRVRLSGGEYAFLARYVHPSVGVMAGWISLTAGFAAPVAAAALVLGEYVLGVSEPTLGARVIATLWILLCAGLHGINLRTGSWVNNGVVALKLVGFLVFAIACVRFLAAASPSEPSAMALSGPLLDSGYFSSLLQPGIWLVIVVQLFFISLSYTGFNASIYIAEEVPGSRSVWLSMILASVMVTVLYLGLNGLFLACTTSERIIEGGDYFVSNVAYDVGGEWLRSMMRVTIALSSATSVLAMTATGPRVYAQMATDGWLPRMFAPAEFASSGESPRLAIVTQAVASTAFVWAATVKDLIDYLGLTLTACGAVATCTLWIAFRELNSIQRVRWWEHACLLIYLAGAVVLLSVAITIKPVQFWLCVATFVAGVAIFVFSSRNR
jgi:APA family basic amino acid/polyamine antiporter